MQAHQGPPARQIDIGSDSAGYIQLESTLTSAKQQLQERIVAKAVSSGRQRQQHVVAAL